MKNNYSSSSLWLHVLERLKIDGNESSQKSNNVDELFLEKQIYHLTIKRGDIFKHSTHTVHNKIHVEIQFCQLQDFPDIEQIVQNYEATTKLTFINLPPPLIDPLLNLIFVGSLTSKLEFIKICSMRLKKQELQLLIQHCSQLKTLMLPNCKIDKVISFTEIIKGLPLLEDFDGLTTKGIGISPHIFNFFLQKHRVMKTLLISPIKVIFIDQILGYLPFWETYVINSNPSKSIFNAGICIRLDSIFSSSKTEKTDEFQRSIDFVANVTNMIYANYKENAIKLNIINIPGNEAFMPKTATRVRQIKEKCLYFELPTENNFLQN